MQMYNSSAEFVLSAHIVRQGSLNQQLALACSRYPEEVPVKQQRRLAKPISTLIIKILIINSDFSLGAQDVYTDFVNFAKKAPKLALKFIQPIKNDSGKDGILKAIFNSILIKPTIDLIGIIYQIQNTKIQQKLEKKTASRFQP